MQTNNRPLLTFKNFNFSYERRETSSPTIDIPDLSFYQGEVVLLTGSSGCGKSTLAKAAAGVLKEIYPYQVKGNIFIEDNIPIEQLSLAQIALTIGLVQQDPDSQLCTFTVEQEVAFGLENLRYPPNEINEIINWALSVTNTKHLRYRETSKISGGEKQRVVLAAVLALSPKFIILDEPTAYLDPDGTNRIVELLKKFRKKKDLTILIIEHKLSKFLSFADRLLIMDKGKIIKQFNKNELTSKLIASFPNIRPLDLSKNIMIEQNPDYNEEFLKINNLTFSYGNKAILQNINFSLAKHEILGIIGPNGAGKSTLLQCINGILSLNGKEKLTYKNTDISSATPAKRAKYMGTVFQNPNFQLFERTVEKELIFTAENLNILSSELTERAKKSLEVLNLTNYKDKTPFALSYGEKKRLTVASVTLHNPSIILLDEPFIGQDYRNILLILEQLESNPWSLIIVSHDTELLSRICNRILFLNDGLVLVDDHPRVAFQKVKELGWEAYIPSDFNLIPEKKEV